MAGRFLFGWAALQLEVDEMTTTNHEFLVVMNLTSYV